jgi:hypothetical protein
MAQVIEHLARKCEALSSVRSMREKKKSYIFSTDTTFSLNICDMYLVESIDTEPQDL